jgi:glyoxylase-like metal-dependent hydrolase (beta-lactamase superfamily II)
MTNAYLIGENETNTAVVIDPAWDGHLIHAEAERRGWRISQIWLTHAHFDHFGGAAAIANAYDALVPVALHPADQTLWRMHGGAMFFGVQEFDPGPEPTISLAQAMHLTLGRLTFEVRETPGHTQGHVVFYEPTEGLMFCGDLIFQGSVGRTDLPGGDMATLLRSIKQEILPLPDGTRLFSGHGPETTVGQERVSNPFVTAYLID